MPPMGLEPTISASERPPQTYALEPAATGTGKCLLKYKKRQPDPH